MSENNNAFDFSKVEVPSVDYLMPGYYKVNITAAKYVVPTDKKPDGSAKTPYLEVTFSANAGKTTQKMYLTDKTLSTFQYFHESWFGKRCDKPINTIDALGRYFEKVLMIKPEISKMLCLAGKKVGDKVYSELPYLKFILPDEMNVEEGPWSEDSLVYKQFVRVEQNASTKTNDVMLPVSSAASSNDSIEDDLPF